jgi:hypothetical protein
VQVCYLRSNECCVHVVCSSDGVCISQSMPKITPEAESESAYTAKVSVGLVGDLPFTREATWLILPVVICLSQRLSHACLSTCRIKAKPRMAH